MQAGGPYSLKSSFETFSHPSGECEALIRDFPFAFNYFFPKKLFFFYSAESLIAFRDAGGYIRAPLRTVKFFVRLLRSYICFFNLM